MRQRQVFACDVAVGLPSGLRDFGTTVHLHALCTVSDDHRGSAPVFEKVELTTPKTQASPSPLLKFLQAGNLEATDLMLGIINEAYRAYDRAREIEARNNSVVDVPLRHGASLLVRRSI